MIALYHCQPPHSTANYPSASVFGVIEMKKEHLKLEAMSKSAGKRARKRATSLFALLAVDSMTHSLAIELMQ